MLTHTHKNMHRHTIEEKVVIIYARVRPFVYLCMAPGESRDHFNHKGKSVLISPLQSCQGGRMMQQGYFDIREVDDAIKRCQTSTLQLDGHRKLWLRMSNTFPCCTVSWNHLWAEFWPNGFHKFSSYSLWYSGSHSQQLW